MEQIVSLYESGKTAKEIALLLNKHETTIHKILRKNGIPTKNKKVKYTIENLPENIKQEIIEKYFSGTSANKIAKEYGVYHTFILDILRSNGIKIFKANKFIRRYQIHENIFDTIDSEEKAYFLGLLYADGCNTPKYRKVTLSLQEEDKEIIEKLAALIFEKRPLEFINYDGKAKNQFRLVIYNKHISSKLEELGCVPRKSLILKFPKWFSDQELIRHFIRGYFDGDGSLHSSVKRGKKTPTFSWSLTSTKEFCENVQNFIQENVDINFYLTSLPNNITYKLSSGGNLQVLRLMDWLYRDSSIFLRRKYNKYLELLALNMEKHNDI